MAIAAMPLLVAMLAWHWVVAIGVLPYGGPWSAIRLAPSMGLRHGYRLYEPRGLGPVLGWIYPPVAPLAYLPATLLGEPGAAVIAGRCLTAMYYYAPAVWLILTAPAAGGSCRWTRVVLVLTFALITSQSTALSYCSTEIHADATALALGAAALGLLGRSRGGTDWAWQLGAVIVAALAVWAKQLTVVVFAVLPLWVLVRDGLRPALRFLAIWIAGGLAVSLPMLYFFPPEGLFYNILTIPSRHPWTVIGPIGIVSVFVKMQTDHIVLWVLIVAGLLLRFTRREESAGATGDPGGREAWPLFLLVGLLESPLAVLGMIKVGGYDNNLSYSVYYLALGGMLLLASVAGRGRAADRDPEAPTLPLMILGVNLMLALVGTERLATEMAGGVYPGRDARDAIRYLRAHPGEAYFPWHPLEHLMVDGKATHSEYGVWDRKLAGDPMSREHFLRYVPLTARRICYPDGITVAEQITLKYAGGSWRVRELPELPGWTCFERYDGRPVFESNDR
jgi:hypothetical protein